MEPARPGVVEEQLIAVQVRDDHFVVERDRQRAVRLRWPDNREMKTHGARAEDQASCRAGLKACSSRRVEGLHLVMLRDEQTPLLVICTQRRAAHKRDDY